MPNAKIVDLPISKVDFIFHISDIHIRTLKRHAEYNIVFGRLYKYLKYLSKKKTFIIVITGDIAHSKTDVSSEYFLMVQRFIRNLSSIAPVILFLGNHDCNLNNVNRTDAITPVVKTLQLPNVHFIANSGIYRTENIDFIAWSVFDQPENYILPSTVESDKIKIVLYHGIIHNTKTDGGFNLENPKVTQALFEGADFGLCGDIHKRQIISESPLIAYAGSLIQQDYTESTEKGGLLWNLKKKTVTEVNIDNDYQYVTIEINVGKVSPHKKFNKKLRARFISYETSVSDLDAIISDYKSKYSIIDFTIINRLYNASNTVINTKNYHLRDITDIKTQNELLTEFISQRDVKKTQDILNIHKRISSDVLNKTLIRNIQWKIGKFEFSNMFSYGEGNEIDFEKFKGLNGLFAKNHTGKTALFDALCWCLFDKCYRTSYASDVLNVRKSSFECRVEIFINDIKYVIHRKAKKSLKGYWKGRVSETVYFYYYDKNGKEVTLNGEQRRDTNDIITQYIGTYEHFILTTLSLQENYSSFISSPQRDKKDMLSTFAGLDIFEELYNKANEEAKQINNEISRYSSQDLNSSIQKIEDDNKTRRIQLKDINKNILKQKKNVEVLSQKILNTLSEIKVIENNLTALNAAEVDLGIGGIISQKELQIQDLTQKHTALDFQLNELLINLSGYDIKEIQKQIDILHSKVLELANLRNSLKLLSTNLKHIEKKHAQLQQLEYDPNCKYCMNNIFVKDAINSKEQLKKLIKDKEELEKKIIEKEKDDCLYNELLKLQNDFNVTSQKHESLLASYKSIQQTIKYETERLGYLKTKQITQQTNLTKIKEQTEILKEKNKQLDDLKKEYEIVKKILSDTENEYRKNEIQYNVNKNNLKQYYKDKERLNELYREADVYKYYLEATHRNGIPSFIINELVPFIQTQANNLLQTTDFNIEFEITEGGDIQTYIIYNNNKRWSINLSSGMEKFLSSVAIRMALISVTHLPRPNFCVIDEGFGVLDSDTVMSLTTVLDYLKNLFEFVVIVSHIDVMRDFVDHSIDINVDSKQFSNIVA